MKRTLLIVVVAAAGYLSFPAPEVVRAAPDSVAVLWEGRSIMADSVLKGFTQRMAEIAPNVAINVYPELNSLKECEDTFRRAEATTKGIVFLRSSGADFLAKTHPKVPCFIGACNNPEEMGVIKNLEAPEGNVTGVTYFIPYQKKVDLLTKLFPNAKSVALLVEAGHPSGPIEQKGTREECAKRGIAYHEVVASNVEQLTKGAKALVGKVDLFIITNTRLVMDNVTSLLFIANPAKIPVFSYAQHAVSRGAAAGLAADDKKLGSMLADSVVDVVVRGLPVSRVPVKMDGSPLVLVNASVMKSLGLAIPETMANRVVQAR